MTATHPEAGGSSRQPWVNTAAARRGRQRAHSVPGMSHDENHEMEDEVETKSKERKVAKHDSGAADLERVTNYAEEKEIKSDASFISVINDVKRQDDANKLAKEQELAKVSIKKEDVEVIMRELEIPKQKAERALREHQGNLIETLVTLTN